MENLNNISNEEIDMYTPEALAVKHMYLLAQEKLLKAARKKIESRFCALGACVDINEPSLCASLQKQPFRVFVKNSTSPVNHNRKTLRNAFLLYLQQTGSQQSPSEMEAVADQAVQFVWSMRPTKPQTNIRHKNLRFVRETNPQ